MPSSEDKCPMCGVIITPGSKFCQTCGFDLSKISFKDKKQDKEEKKEVGTKEIFTQEESQIEPTPESQGAVIAFTLLVILAGLLIIIGLIFAFGFGSYGSNFQIGVTMIIIGVIILFILFSMAGVSDGSFCYWYSCYGCNYNSDGDASGCCDRDGDGDCCDSDGDGDCCDCDDCCCD